MTMTKKRRISLIILIVFLVSLFSAFAIYVNIYYKADGNAKQATENAQIISGDLHFKSDSDKGIIIYPGAKVEEKAYSLLAQKLNEQGFYVVIAKMPFRLAIMSSNRAEGIIREVEQVKSWTLVGHSLGGTAASIFVEKGPEKVDGIVFLGSYPYKDLSGFEGFGLNIRASNDKILNIDAFNKSENYNPKNSLFKVIEGGNHAGFACYGEQKGDGQATISCQQQIEITVSYIIEAINSNS